MAYDKNIKKSKYVTLVKLFNRANYMQNDINNWLLNNRDVDIIDIKISGKDSNAIGLIIYKKYINDKK